jgi:RNA polymerase sigma-70 factor (ECF subfamily)
MKEIRAESMPAFDCLYGRYCTRVYQFAYRLLKSAGDAENIVQDVFLSLYENRHRVEKCSSVRCYIFTIAYNASISQLRKRVRETRFIEYLASLQSASEPSPEQMIEYNELAGKLNEIINSLPDRQREIYLLHRNKGFKYREIATRMHISVNTVENQMSSAIRKIRLGMHDLDLLSLLFCLFIL